MCSYSEIFTKNELESFVMGCFKTEIRELSHMNRNFKTELQRVKALRELMVSVFASFDMDNFTVGNEGCEYKKSATG